MGGISRGTVLYDALDICDCVQARVCNRLTRGVITCVDIFHEEVCVPCSEGIRREAYKSQDQVHVTLLRVSFRCAAIYPRRVLLSDEGLWGLVTYGCVSYVFPGFAKLSVRFNLA